MHTDAAGMGSFEIPATKEVAFIFMHEQRGRSGQENTRCEKDTIIYSVLQGLPLQMLTLRECRCLWVC